MPVRSELPVAVVTGGNRGVGLEVCRRLSNLGYAVVLGSRDLRRAEIAAKEIDPEGERIIPCHIEVDNSVNIDGLGDWVKERFGRVDAVVNNASTAPDLWAMAASADSVAGRRGTGHQPLRGLAGDPVAAADVRSSPRPRVVNVSSEGGSITRIAGGRPAYSVSKAGAQRAHQDARRRTVPGRHPGQRGVPRLDGPGWRQGRQCQPRQWPHRRAGRAAWCGRSPSQRWPHRHVHPRRPRDPVVTGIAGADLAEARAACGLDPGDSAWCAAARQVRAGGDGRPRGKYASPCGRYRPWKGPLVAYSEPPPGRGGRRHSGPGRPEWLTHLRNSVGRAGLGHP